LNRLLSGCGEELIWQRGGGVFYKAIRSGCAAAAAGTRLNYVVSSVVVHVLGGTPALNLNSKEGLNSAWCETEGESESSEEAIQLWAIIAMPRENFSIAFLCIQKRERERDGKFSMHTTSCVAVIRSF